MIGKRSIRESPSVWTRRAGDVIGVCEPMEELEPRVCLAYAVADWFPLTGGNEWHHVADIDQISADGFTRSTAGVAIGQQTTTRLATQLRMFDNMYAFNDERFFKLAAGGLKLIQDNRWGDFGSQAIRYWDGGATLMPQTVNIGDVFTYSVRVTAETHLGPISGTAAGTVTIVGIETVRPFPMHPFRFNALKVVRSEVLNGNGSGWTSQVDVNETMWLAKGIGLVSWSHEQRDRTSFGTDQTSRVVTWVDGGNIVDSSFGLTVDGRNERVSNRDNTVSFDGGTNFGVIDVNGQYGVSTFTVTNRSPRPMSINRVSISGRDNADFKITRSPVGELMPGEARTLKVRFNPIAAGIRAARVVIESSDPLANPYTFKIQGEGVLLGTINVREIDRSTPIISGSMTPSWATGTAFGGVLANGMNFTDRTFVITNTGPGNLVLGHFGVSYLMSAEAIGPFAIVSPPQSMTLSPMSSTTFVVRLRPYSIGVINAKIWIESNDRHMPRFEFVVRGSGT